MHKIEFRSNTGYGDFITGLCYAHSSVIKYQTPVELVLHWPMAEHERMSPTDPHTVFEYYKYIEQMLRPVDGLTITHKFESKPDFRFINNFEEHNPLHGLWYLKEEPQVEKGLVALWTSRHNLEFPGYEKDPAYDHWDQIVENLEADGYTVREITYRQPISDAMDVLTRCEYGVGYEGMVHQFFKFTWRPFVVFSKRVGLTKLLGPQGCVLSEPAPLLYDHVGRYVKESKQNIKRLKSEHEQYMQTYEDPTQHRLYNKVI